MEYKDYYKTLAVEKSATVDEIKKQYRSLARKFHPDVNTTDKNATAKFAEISEAYEVLSDPEKRQKYDQLGSDWEQHRQAGPGDNFDWSRYANANTGGSRSAEPDWDDLFGGSGEASEFFRNIFGNRQPGAGGRPMARRGADLSAELAISLEEAFAGGSKILSLGDQRIRLKLKPGIWDHQSIKIAGKGAPGSNGAPSDDLYITFLLQPHPEYRLDGVDLHKTIQVGIYAAVLGTTLEIRAISGTFKVKIPAGTKNGSVLRLRGKGFPSYGQAGGFGDLFLKVALQLPENLTAEELGLFQKLAALRQAAGQGVPG